MVSSPLRHHPTWQAIHIDRSRIEEIPATLAGLARAARRDPAATLRLTLLAPFWIGSEAPPPSAWRPQRLAHRTVPADPAGAHLVARANRVARRVGIGWTVGSMFRGLTVAGLVLCVWVLLSLAGVGAIPSLGVAAAMLGGGLAAGAVYGWMIWPDAPMVAAMLDRTFDLRERLVTAFDHSSDGSRIARLQRADAANAMNRALARLGRLDFLPIREAAMLLITTGSLVTLLMVWVPREGIAQAAANAIPQFVPASERLAVPDSLVPTQAADAAQAEPTAVSIADVQERGQESQSASTALDRIGQALETNPRTKGVGEAIAQGDYASASDQLRKVAEDVSSMSQQERDALADQFDKAASDLQETNPALAQQAQDTADALRKGGPEAQKALNDLADQIDSSGKTVQSGDSSSSQAQESPGQGNNQSQQGQQSQQGESSDSGQSSTQADPGTGSDAAPGVSQNPQQSDQGSSTGGSTSDTGQGGASGNSSTDQQSNGQPSDQPSQGSDSAQQGGDSTTATDQGNSTSQGSGSSDQQASTDPSQGSQKGGTSAEDANTSKPSDTASQGKASEDPASGGNQPKDGSTGTESQGSSSLELDGSSQDSVQAGGDSGTSSLGTGSDATSGSGSQTQSEVGIAGPDSNRVPDTLRQVVRDFFGKEP